MSYSAFGQPRLQAVPTRTIYRAVTQQSPQSPTGFVYEGPSKDSAIAAAREWMGSWSGPGMVRVLGGILNPDYLAAVPHKGKLTSVLERVCSNWRNDDGPWQSGAYPPSCLPTFTAIGPPRRFSRRISGFGDEPSPNGVMAPECEDPTKLRQMLTAAGYSPPATGDENADKMGLALTLIEFAMDNGFTDTEIKSESPDVARRVCDKLMAAAGESGDGELSTEAKVAIGVGVLVAIGGIAYLTLR